MVTKEKILECWFSLKKLPNYQIVGSDFIQTLYYDLYHQYAPMYWIVSPDDFGRCETYRERENYPMKVKCKDLINLLDNSSPIATLFSTGGTYYYFFQDLIVEADLKCCGKDFTIAVRAHSHSEKAVADLATKIPWIPASQTKCRYQFAYSNMHGVILKRDLYFKKFEVDLKKTYNDDIPISQIDSFLKGESSGMVLLYGAPGTGKTTFIKHLMMELENEKLFVMTPKELFERTPDSFVDFFSGTAQKNAVFILEDCEKLLLRREKGTSLETILNMTDGLLGSSFKTKFICTFNTDLGNIDTAILRKGRLKVGYEFKKLSLEKTKALCQEATQEMTLAEIFNKEDNGTATNERKKIGF